MVYEQYSYVLTEIAEEDMEEAFDYITQKLFNPEAAAAFADELEDKLDEICRKPKSGRLVHNPYLKRDDVRRVLVKNHIAYYLIDEEEAKVVVLRVVHNRRDQDIILKSV